jgi:prevent-host-death family protein
MPTFTVKQAREKFARLVETARRGTPVTITRRGRQVATLTGIAQSKRSGLPDLTAFRASLPTTRKRRTTTIDDLRRAERY